MRPRPGKVGPMRTTSRRKALTEADRAEWAAYAAKVRPLPGVVAPPPPVVPPPVVVAAPSVPPPARPVASGPAALHIGVNPGGLDAASWKRLQAGKLPPTRTLDLHGRTVQRAFSALHAFLEAAHADRVRVVEVITGRGAGETGGILRRELPMWLNLPALRPLVLAASHPHAANVGSVRLLLRRPRG